MTFFISKYALTSGILEIQGEYIKDDNTMIRDLGRHYMIYYHKGDFHLTRESAEQKAKEMATKKKATMLKQIAKLEKNWGV